MKPKVAEPIPQLVPIAHWHIPLYGLYREVSLVFYGRTGKKVQPPDLDGLETFLQMVRQQRVSEDDYSI